MLVDTSKSKLMFTAYDDDGFNLGFFTCDAADFRESFFSPIANEEDAARRFQAFQRKVEGKSLGVVRLSFMIEGLGSVFDSCEEGRGATYRLTGHALSVTASFQVTS